MRRASIFRGERGALSIEFLLIISALILVFLVMLQYAVRSHAHQIAEAAAEEGLAAATAYDGSVATGEQAARRYLDDLGSDLKNPQIAVDRNQSTAAVAITGDVQPFIPFLPVRVSVRLEGPVEQFVASP